MWNHGVSSTAPGEPFKAMSDDEGASTVGFIAGGSLDIVILMTPTWLEEPQKTSPAENADVAEVLLVLVR